LLMSDVRYRDRDFVLVDESHNFRHANTQRYRVLEAYLAAGRRCVLLTATPRNKSITDIYNQLKLFHQSDQTLIPIDPPNLRQYFQLVEEGQRALPGLLANILIRRTRDHILRWYGYDAETNQPVDPDSFEEYRTGKKKAFIWVKGVPSFFPQRSLHTVEYSIEATYQGLYAQLRQCLEIKSEEPNAAARAHTLTYARYGLWNYVREDKRYQSPYADLQRAGANLRGLMRVSLFKRLESSVYAFRETLKRQIRIHQAFLDALQSDIIAAGIEAQTLLYESDRFEEDRLIDALGNVSGRYQVADFNRHDLQMDIEHDKEVLVQMLDMVTQITPDNDAKLQRLIEVLRQPMMRSGKSLIFTQYADTARYIHSNLVDAGLGKNVAVIYSDRTSKSSIVG
ncbi:MAG TPA: hypothetical protein PKD55_26885, partial [Bellilinea sp.]|nr:hypothetical protein [Bellilinea sp.]